VGEYCHYCGRRLPNKERWILRRVYPPREEEWHQFCNPKCLVMYFLVKRGRLVLDCKSSFRRKGKLVLDFEWKG